MHDLLNCCQMELLCRKCAKADPEHSWKWLARAERWKSLGHRKITSSRSNSGQADFGPMAMGPTQLTGTSELESGRVNQGSGDHHASDDPTILHCCSNFNGTVISARSAC
jgi:hypothetical protein